MDKKITLPKNISIKFTLDNQGRFYEIPLVMDKVYKINTNRFGLRYLAVVLESDNNTIKIFSPNLKGKTGLLKKKQAEINFNFNNKFFYFKVEIIKILEYGEFVIKMPKSFNQDQRRSHVRTYHNLEVGITHINMRAVKGLDGSRLILGSKDLSATGLKLTSPIRDLLVKNLKMVEPEEDTYLPKIKIEFTLENSTFQIAGAIVWAHKLGTNFEHGVQFIGVNIAAQDAIMKFVFEQELAVRKKFNK